ncbi:hypothetical protein Tco_0191495 [Tanacetum coccineum]
MPPHVSVCPSISRLEMIIHILEALLLDAESGNGAYRPCSLQRYNYSKENIVLDPFQHSLRGLLTSFRVPTTTPLSYLRLLAQMNLMKLTTAHLPVRSSLIDRIKEIDSSSELQIDEALKRIQKQLSSEHVKENGTFYNKNECPDDLGFTYNEQNYSGFITYK